MLQDPSTTLDLWNSIIVGKNLTTNRDAVYNFTIKHFNRPAGTDITSCIPTDFNSSNSIPSTLRNKISDPNLQIFADSVYQLWRFLCKEINIAVYTQPSRHSLIALPHPQMIVAGGRFREVYYWELSLFSLFYAIYNYDGFLI